MRVGLVAIHAGIGRSAAAISVSLSSWACARQAVPGPAATQLQDVIFDRYSPLSANAEIARRTLTPLTFVHGQQALAARGQALADRPVDLAKEKFAVYVPAGAPPATGYGLLVFVSPGPLSRRVSRRVLNAGSEPIAGERGIYLPPAALFGTFRRTRLVYVSELSSRLAEAEGALARGDREDARARIAAIDRRYAGLSAPAIVELDARLTAQR